MAHSTKSISFGGTNEYVTFGNVLNFERNLPFSISFWVKTSNTGGGTILGKSANSTGKGYSLFCNVTTGTLVWSISGGGTGGTITATSSSSFVTGSWVHCVLTYNGSSINTGLKIWRNAVDVTNPQTGGPLTATIVCTDPLVFGALRPGSSYYIFQMDEGAYYDKVLSGAEIAWIYNGGFTRSLTDSGCPSNLVAWWRMGEGDTYPTVLDQTANHYDGTMVNMETTDFGDDYPGKPSLDLACALLSRPAYNDGRYLSFDGSLSPRVAATAGKHASWNATAGAAVPDRSIYFKGRKGLYVPLGGGLIPTYEKRVKDEGLSPPPAYLTWTTTDPEDDPPVPPAVGPWTDEYVQDKVIK